MRTVNVENGALFLYYCRSKVEKFLPLLQKKVYLPLPWLVALKIYLADSTTSDNAGLCKIGSTN